MSLIHRYQSNGYNIVLDINSGCIHLVDLVTYEVLPFMEEGLSEQEIVDIAAFMAEKVVGNSIDVKIQDALIDETLKEMGEHTWQS